MKTAIYARVSDSNQEKEETVETQLMVVRDFCEANDINVVEEFIDEAQSGEKTALTERPSGERLIEAIRAKRIDTVLVYDLTRLGRDWRQGQALDALKRLRVRVISVMTPQSNADDYSGRVSRKVDQFTGGLFLEYIRQNTMNGRYKAVRQGKWMSSVIPYGYVRDGDTLAIDPVEADVVRTIFQWAVDGIGLHGIVRQLLADDATPRLEMSKHFGQSGCDGKGRCKAVHMKQEKWHTTTVHRILTSGRYIGEATYGPDKLPMTIPAIIDSETFEAANEALKRRKPLPMTDVRNHYLLRGLLRCRVCGGGCVGLTARMRDGSVRQFYECINRRRYEAQRPAHKSVRGRWAASFVESVVRRWAFEVLTNTEAALARARLISGDDVEVATQRERERTRAQKELAGLDEEERRTKERRAWFDTKDEYDEALARIEAQRMSLQTIIDAPAPDVTLQKTVANVIALRPTGPDELYRMLTDAGVEVGDVSETIPTPEQLEAYWSVLVRRTITAVWLERDGETITVEGALPDDLGPLTREVIASLLSGTAQPISPRS